MDYRYIEQLLGRYFEAETTLKEEQILKAFFSQDDEEMPSELRPYKSLFQAMETGDVLGDGFDERVMALISDNADGDSTRKPSSARIISISERLRPLLRAAAVVAVVLTLSTAVNQSFSDGNVWTDEDQVARYQDQMRQAALAAAQADSVLLFSEGIGVKTDSIKADSIMSAGYIE